MQNSDSVKCIVHNTKKQIQIQTLSKKYWYLYFHQQNDKKK